MKRKKPPYTSIRNRSYSRDTSGDPEPTDSMSQAILRAIRGAKNGITFARLAKEIPGFMGGTRTVTVARNVHLWAGMADEAADAMVALYESGKIGSMTCPWEDYRRDGSHPALPVAGPMDSVFGSATRVWEPVLLTAA